MTSRMTMSRRITIQKRPLNFYLLAFCGIIYQNLLHRQVYIAVSSQKLLFINFLKSCCMLPLSWFSQNLAAVWERCRYTLPAHTMMKKHCIYLYTRKNIMAQKRGKWNCVLNMLEMSCHYSWLKPIPQLPVRRMHRVIASVSVWWSLVGRVSCEVCTLLCVWQRRYSDAVQRLHQGRPARHTGQGSQREQRVQGRRTGLYWGRCFFSLPSSSSSSSTSSLQGCIQDLGRRVHHTV